MEKKPPTAGTAPVSLSTDGSRPATPATAVQSSQPPVSQPPNGQLSFSESWMYWKKQQGSAGGQNRRVSSIDPLVPETEQDPLNTGATPVNNEVLLAPTNGIIANPQQSSQAWTSYLNPLSYVPPAMFHLQLPDGLNSGSAGTDSQSEHSSSTHTTPNGGWFSWVWGNDKHDEDDDGHGAFSTAETKKIVKECKKQVQSPDTVWAWYNEPLVPGHESEGEMSLLGTKTETRPVRVKRYPNKASGALPIPKDHPALVEPSLTECYREITTRTKVRLTTQLYYNFCKEKHLYIKRNKHTPHIRNILVISVVGQMKTKHNITAKQLSDYTTDSIKTWFREVNPNQEYRVETISIEAAKIDDSSLENLLVLLANWRESIKNADFLSIVGFKNTIPLATLILDSLISRKLAEGTPKFGLHFIEGIIPGPYTYEQDSSNISYISASDFEQSLSRLLHEQNVKLSILGSFSNLPGTLALNYEHPNIFRSIYIPQTTAYNNEFEVETFRLLLMAHNLGRGSSRPLIQLSKYFQGQPTISDELSDDIFIPAIYNALSTTRLIKSMPLKTLVIEDPILSNNYNLVWTLHAFVDDFKALKNVESLKRIKSWLKAYEKWDPQTKNLKDLKYMLEVLKVEDYSRGILRE